MKRIRSATLWLLPLAIAAILVTPMWLIDINRRSVDFNWVVYVGVAVIGLIIGGPIARQKGNLKETPPRQVPPTSIS